MENLKRKKNLHTMKKGENKQRRSFPIPGKERRFVVVEIFLCKKQHENPIEKNSSHTVGKKSTSFLFFFEIFPPNFFEILRKKFDFRIHGILEFFKTT